MKTSLHHSYTFFNIFFYISIIFSYAFSTATNHTIDFSSTESFTFSCNRTIVSPNDIFELGVFKLESSSQGTDRWYLGIWFKKISQRTYVWVANRYHPLSSPVGTIRVCESKLALFDESNIIVWSTNLIEESKERSPIVAEFLADGNFVLRHSNVSERDEFLWQSFDSPTDTLLPGMKLGWEFRTERYKYITSWHNETDPSSGNFSYGLEIPDQTQENPEMYIWSFGKKINRVSPWNGINPQNQHLMNLTFVFPTTQEEMTYSFQTLGSNYTTIMRLSSQGYLQFLMWNETSSLWEIFWNFPNDECDSYEACGPNSYCDVPYMCYCIRGFKPKNPKAWTQQNMSDGCVRKMPLNCSEFEFFQLKNIKLPDATKAVVDKEIGFDKCKQRCVTDCNCTAFTTGYQSGISSCVIWTGELLDVQKYAGNIEGHHNLYVKQGKDKKPHGLA